MEQTNERLEILKKVKQFEREKRWDEDVEEDPPTKELLPNQIDYLNKKITRKIANKIANMVGTSFYEKLIKNHQLIIKEVKGIENFLSVKDGAILTCNHFNVCDNYAVWRAIKPYMGKRKLWKIIREGNYTNSPPPFGLILRNCNTLPLSSNSETMKKFITAVRTLLGRGEKILIYPEQAMWFNYKKPRPCKNGAFKFAVNSNVPIIPFFITMEDSEYVGGDGLPVQAYTVNILKPIYPDKNLNRSENIEKLKNENFEQWKQCYEKTYKIPLKYSDSLETEKTPNEITNKDKNKKEA